MEKNNILNSKSLGIILLSAAGLVILIFVFSMGVFIGTKKAEFSFRWADQYHRNFGGPQGGLFGEFMGMDEGIANANGVFGQIIKIDNGTLTVQDKDNTEKIVLVNDDTSIILQRKNIKLSDLKINDNIIVIGDPNNQGQIQGELIRVMPAMPKNLPANNTIPATNPLP